MTIDDIRDRLLTHFDPLYIEGKTDNEIIDIWKQVLEDEETIERIEKERLEWQDETQQLTAIV